MKMFHKDFKFRFGFYSFGIGFSYTPLNDIDKKTWFTFRKIDWLKNANWFKIKLFLLDIDFIWEPKAYQRIQNGSKRN